MNTDKCLIVSLNVFSVCKEPSRDPSAAAPFRGVLSNVEGKKGKERKGKDRKGKEGATRTRLGWGLIFWAAEWTPVNCVFSFFVFLPCNPTLRSLHCLLGGCNRD